MMLPRVILAEDHRIVVEAFSTLLRTHCDVVATVSNGRDLLNAAAAFKPDLIVLDIGMPLLNGLEAGQQLKSKMPSVKLVFLTMHGDPDLAIEAMRLGVIGYLLKSSAPSELFHAIQEVLSGRCYVTPRIACGMEEGLMRDPRRSQRLELLTPRQREVIQLLAEGKTAKVIADILHITGRTVAFHKYRIKKKLGLSSSAALVQFAVKNHIVVT